MAKYFFTSGGVYLSWTGIESLAPADVYPSLTGVKQVIAAPLPSGVDPGSVSLNLGTGAITYATNSPVIAQQTTAAVANGLGIALDLIESLVQIVSKVADMPDGSGYNAATGEYGDLAAQGEAEQGDSCRRQADYGRSAGGRWIGHGQVRKIPAPAAARYPAPNGAAHSATTPSRTRMANGDENSPAVTAA